MAVGDPLTSASKIGLVVTSFLICLFVGCFPTCAMWLASPRHCGFPMHACVLPSLLGRHSPVDCFVHEGYKKVLLALGSSVEAIRCIIVHISEVKDTYTKMQCTDTSVVGTYTCRVSEHTSSRTSQTGLIQTQMLMCTMVQTHVYSPTSFSWLTSNSVLETLHYLPSPLLV